MSTPRPLPPAPGIGGKSGQKRLPRRRRWPGVVIPVVSLAGIAVAIVALSDPIAQTRELVAIVGFVGVVLAGTIMLFIQRVLDVGVARMSGTPTTSSFDIADKLAFGLLLAASVANGIVVALEVARQ